MYETMVGYCNQYNDGMITAGELRHKLVKAMLENELSLEVMSDREFNLLVAKLIQP